VPVSAASTVGSGSATADGPEATDVIPPTVTPGMRGPLAGELQDVMIRRGLIADTVGNRDEFYGPATQAIIRQFQNEHGLEVDARVGPKTWAALLQLD
jgi:peptidoglycan hydrolase-like protein with peptidoglycan-binding domain